MKEHETRGQCLRLGPLINPPYLNYYVWGNGHSVTATLEAKKKKMFALDSWT